MRLADQPAFAAAAQEGPVIPVYVLDDEGPGDRKLGGAARWWLHHSLDALAKGLVEQHRSRLILRRGNAVEELCRIAQETGARSIHALRHYEPWWRNAEEELAGEVDLCLHDGNYLMPPCAVTTGSGDPYEIYTPFMKALMRQLPPRDPLPEPRLTPPDTWPQSEQLSDWALLPQVPDWAGGIQAEWEAGELAAQERLDAFLEIAASYDADRNLPSVEGTSRLSPHLHWGEISPLQVWHALEGRRGKGVETFRSELIWRDFAQNLLCQFPHYPERSYRDRFERFPWRDPATDTTAAGDLKAWQQGRTGYPVVDAGMRQLWRTGWMHNRVRMIAASFLIKHLLIDWRHGERWFWGTLVDADYANNGTNWQWVSGTGVDAQLFTRIMAPLGQSEKFDAAAYIREFVPELAEVPEEQIHDPLDHTRPAAYPPKLVGHREARERALGAYRRMREREG